MDLETYLRSEGLKPFQDVQSYWNWVNRKLGPKVGRQFIESLQQRAMGDLAGSEQFYDLIAQPGLAQVAANFEYGLLVQMAGWVTKHLPLAGKVVELGCHSGLLLRYYAQMFPAVEFIGIDRSEAAILLAKSKAQEQKIRNIRFIIADIEQPLDETLSADCVISGRVIGELMGLRLRRRLSWIDYQYPALDPALDKKAIQTLQNCRRMVSDNGELLIVERLSSFDRLNRIWIAVQSAGYTPDPVSLSPVGWQDISGEHTTWLFSARPSTPYVVSDLDIRVLPRIKKESEASGHPTRLMVEGVLAWQTWQSLTKTVDTEETLRWKNGEEVHYEIGSTCVGMGYVYIASNTDIHLLTVFLKQDQPDVEADLREYISQLKQSGAQSAF